MKLVLLGCGFHGRGVAYELAEMSEISDVLVADRDGQLARSTAERIGARWAEVDVQDEDRLREVIRGASLVFNAVGPYHYRQNGVRVVQAALAERVPYVDMSDDHEVAESLLLDPTWDEAAKSAGIAVITGTGIAPGLTGMLAKLGCDRVPGARAVDVSFSWNYSLAYPAALHHFFRLNSGLAPQFIDGEYVRPGAFTGREEAVFLPPVGKKEVWYTGINDPVSISHSLPRLRRVTARGAYHQKAANDLVQAMVRWGFTSYDPLPNSAETPFEYLMHFVQSEAGKSHFDIPMEDAPMSVRVDIGATTDEEPVLSFEGQDFSRRGTTSASAVVAKMLLMRDIEFTGVRAPEGCVDAEQYLSTIAQHQDIALFEVQGERCEPLFGPTPVSRR